MNGCNNCVIQIGWKPGMWLVKQLQHNFLGSNYATAALKNAKYKLAAKF